MNPFARVLTLLLVACGIGKAANVHPPAVGLKLSDSLAYLVTPMVKTPSA